MTQYFKLFKVEKDGKEKEQSFEVKKDKKTSEFYHISEIEKFLKKNKGEFLLKTFIKQ